MNTMLFGEFSEMSDLRELGLIAAAAPDQIEAMVARLLGEGAAGTTAEPQATIQPETPLAFNRAASRG